MRLLRGHHESITALAFSRDGSRLASADASGFVRAVGALDLGTIREFQASPRHRFLTTSVSDILFDHEGGNLFATFTPSETDGSRWSLGRWSLDSSKDPNTIEEKVGKWPVLCVGDSSDELVMAHIPYDDYYQQISIWRFSTRTGVRSKSTSQWGRIRGRTILVRGESHFFVVGSESPDVNVFGTVERWQSWWAAHPSAIRGLACPPGRRRLLTAGPNEIRAWDADAIKASTWNTEVPPLLADVRRSGPQLITCLAASPDGQTIAVGRNGGLINLLDTESLSEQMTFRWPIGNVTRLAFAPDGLRIAAGGQKGVIVVWDLE